MTQSPAETTPRFDPALYARLFDDARDAVAVFLPDLRVVYANPAFRGLAPVHDGQPLGDVLGPLADVYDAPVLAVARNGRAATALHHASSDSDGRVLVGNYTPIRDADGGIAGVLLIAHDLPGWTRADEPPPPSRQWQHALPDSDDESCSYAILDSDLRLVRCNDALRETMRAPHATLRAGTPLSVILSVLLGGPAEAGTPKAATVLRHLQRRGGRPVDLHTDDRRRLQISLHRPESGDAVLRVSDVTRARLLQAHIDRQAALLRLVGEAQTSFLMGGDHPRAFSRFLDGLLRIARCHAGLIAAVHGEDRTPGTLAASGAWIEAIAGPTPPVLRRALETAAIAHGEDEADAPGLGHTLVLPVGARDRMIGLVALSDRAAPFDDELVGDLIQTLSTVAAMLSIHTVERHRAQTARDLRASQERVRAVFDTIQEGVVIVAANGAITGFNAAAERLFGHPLREVLGRHVNLLSPEGTLSLFDVRTSREAKAGTEARRHEILARRRDGRTFPAEVSVSRVDVDQEPLFIAIVQDITDRKRVERLKTELVTTVGHDLRTPLTSILGALGLINSGSLPPEKTKDLLAIAERNGRRLLRLITDLLDLERINAGMIAFDPHPTDLGMVLRQSVETHRLLSEAKNLSVVWALPQKPLRVMGDADRLTQVVINIFGNAVRFSPEGGTIEIRARADQGRIRVEIADHGPGIPPSFLPVMFDRFRQLETRVRGTANPGPEGSGLGLSIVRALIELHGGTVGAASPPGGGALVYFELPDETPPNP